MGVSKVASARTPLAAASGPSFITGLLSNITAGRGAIPVATVAAVSTATSSREPGM